MNTSYEWLSQHQDDSQALCTPLSNYRIIRVSGPDTEKFLQGQLSCDIRQLAKQGHLLGAHCNIKGHMISLFRLFYHGPEQVWLRVHSEIAQTAFDSLKKYSIFSKVTLEFADELSGLALERVPQEGLCAGLDMKSGESLNCNDEGCIARYDQNLFELWADDTCLATALKAGSMHGTSEARWIAANIERALPDLRSATSEHFIPQMCNMQAIDGVSFSKGCYTGQEIVTRLQHRGILKKAMYRFSAPAGTEIREGDALFNSEGSSVGEVVLQSNLEGRTTLLAVVQQAQIDAKERLSLESGATVEFQGLPYELDPMLFEKKR